MKIFKLSQPAHGWIDITFGHEPDSYTFAASDVPNDCLRDLAAATARLLSYSVDETIEFPLEPGFIICKLHRNADSVRIIISHPNQDTPVFDAVYPVAAFAKRLKFELLRIEPYYSHKEGWTQPFPHHEVANLG